ncbi:MAG: hypothetical protein JWP97_4322 [Labilithrix sp.]|nr:hypothetical protein [Labilithrix sp.]
MLLAIAAFELRKRFRMLSTWIYMGVLAGVGFFAMIAAGGAFSSVSVGLGADKVHANSPGALHGLITIFCHLGLLITAAVFGQALHQDQEHRIDSLFFTTPVRKIDYLGGRFLGATVFALVVFLPIGLGLWLGTLMPFVEKEGFGDNHFSYYAWPYLSAVVPNVVFSGALFFALAAFTRRMMPVYVGSVLLVIGYLMAGSLFSRLELRTLAALLDPFGLTATRVVVEYRTVSEQNSLLVPLAGILLVNRVLWLGIGLALFGLTVHRFRLAHVGTAEKGGAPRASVPAPPGAPLPRIAPAPGTALLRLLLGETRLAFMETVKNVYFGVIVLAGVLFMVVATLQAGSIYGTTTYPVTRSILEVTGGTFELFILILLTFYSGELVWRERDANIALITDALPVPTWLPLVAKMAALFLVQALLLGVVLVAGVVLQTAKGFFHYEIGLYIESLYGLRLWDYVLLCVLAITVHVVVNHKYVGHFVMVLYYVWTLFMPKLGLEHNLYKFGDHPSVRYSDMNRFGHFLRPVAWFDLYWGFFSVLLAVACALLWPRGVEVGGRARLREAVRRFTVGPRIAAGLALALFLATGAFIFHNTNVLNRYETGNARERARAEYEKTYGPKARELPQPRVVDADVTFDVFPHGTPERGTTRPALHVRGTYQVENAGTEPIATVYVNLPQDQPIERLTLGDTIESASDARLGVHVFTLAVPLQAREVRPLVFDLWFHQRGFENDHPDTEVVENGTFFHSTQLPRIGYADDAELTEDGARKKYGLPAKERMRDLDDARGRDHSYIAHDADWVTFRATVSTTPDQIALAPGYLEKEWDESSSSGPRHVSRFTMDRKMLHFFSVLSARYAVEKDAWNGIPLEIYHHPSHTYDTARMMAGMKDALTYCSEAFGPYQYHQARIVEFPAYATYAQSFPNMIPFSEAVGFVAKVDDADPKDVDYPYYVTAHEIAHQWWAHQVIGADVQGATMLSETLAQYSALMVMKKKVGPERMKRFLAYELDGYLRARGAERKKEVPLLRVENQPYIHYQKGSLVMYALQDYAGQEVVDRALASFLAKTRFSGPPYPTARDLVAELRAAIPASLHGLIEDLVETITLFDNRATSATYAVRPDGKVDVTVKVLARKVRADALGVETEVTLDQLVDIGAVDEAGVVLFREKRRLTSGASEQSFTVPSVPAKAGIDPLNVLVDRKPDDNLVRVEKREAAR